MTGYIQPAPYNLPTGHNIKVHNNASKSDVGSSPYISFSNCFLMNSFEWAVTLSVLLQNINTGALFFTTAAFVRMSYRYLKEDNGTVINKNHIKKLMEHKEALLCFIRTKQQPCVTHVGIWGKLLATANLCSVCNGTRRTGKIDKNQCLLNLKGKKVTLQLLAC
jgi:hypothetical protein